MLYTILQKNALFKDTLSKNCCDIVITSPPYNVGIDYNSNYDSMDYKEYLDFTEQWLLNVFYWVKDTGRLCLNIPLDKNKGGIQSIGSDIIQIAKKVGWEYRTTIIWNESNISRRTAWGSWLSANAPYVIAPVELIVIFCKKQWKRSTKGTSTIDRDEFMQWTNGLWSFNGESGKRVKHPAPFPRELPKRLIRLFSFKEDIILDPFAGSGTTIIESIFQERKSIGIEIDRVYYEQIHHRIHQECKEQFHFLETNPQTSIVA